MMWEVLYWCVVFKYTNGIPCKPSSQLLHKGAYLYIAYGVRLKSTTRVTPAYV